ncbi:MAG: LuxR family transcriptional regulator [Actinomycetota bacterium]|jgi:DNA-binding NarL/FixJ family response regulator
MPATPSDPTSADDAVWIVHRDRRSRDRLASLLAAGGVTVLGGVTEVTSVCAPAIVHLVLVGEPDPPHRLERDLGDLRHRFPHVRVLLLAAHPVRAEAFAAIRSCVDGVIANDAPGNVLLAAVRAVGVGLIAFDEDVLGLFAPRDGVPGAHTADSVPLSMRERQVLVLVATGASNARIAEQLVVSTETVKSHVAHILAKLEVSSRAAAVDRALAIGALAPLGLTPSAR